MSAQSTISLGEASQIPRFTPARPMVHGFGVARLSSYTPDSSYKKAYRYALEDFRASLFTSVYLESIRSYGFARNHEFAIQDSLHTADVIKIDSTQDDDFVYYLIGRVDKQNSSHNDLVDADSLPAAKWMEETFSPMEKERYWIAAGKKRFSEYAPYDSWVESKLNALSKLSNTLNTRVESNIKSTETRSKQFTYTSSKTIFKNIVVLQREISDGYCHTLLAVPKDQIIQLN